MTDIDEVKSRINIVDIIGKRVTLKKAGRNFKALCPFHNEKTPSFMVSPERGTWHCFGCGKGGSAIDFVMESEHVDFVEALESLAEIAGVKLERHAAASPEAKLREKIFEVNHLASEYYHYLLITHSIGENARMYMKKRGVSEKTAKTFSLGYSPNSWDGLFKFLSKKGYDGELLEKAGLVLPTRTGKRGWYDRFRGRFMFALKDHRGQVVGFAGRLLRSEAKDQSSDRQEAKYINTSETPVYIKGNMLYGLDVTKASIQKENQAIVMEGEFDVISSFQAGIGNTVAIKGSALTENHVNLLRRFTERITFALDSDMAGDSAARRGIEIADKAGLDMRVVVLSEGKDPDDVARESPGVLKKAIEDAMPIYDYFFTSAFSRHDVRSAFGKKKIGDELLPVLAKIENPIVAGHYRKKLADLMGLTEESIQEGIKKLRRNVKYQDVLSGETKPQGAKSRDEKMQLYILALVLQGKTRELMEDLTETEKIDDFSYQPVRQILAALQQYLQQQPVFLVVDFAKSLPQELEHVFNEAFLWDLSQLSEQEELYAREWNGVIRDYRRKELRRKIAECTAKFEKLEEGADTRSLEEEIRRFTEELSLLDKS